MCTADTIWHIAQDRVHISDPNLAQSCMSCSLHILDAGFQRLMRLPVPNARRELILEGHGDSKPSPTWHCL